MCYVSNKTAHITEHVAKKQKTKTNKQTKKKTKKQRRTFFSHRKKIIKDRNVSDRILISTINK